MRIIMVLRHVLACIFSGALVFSVHAHAQVIKSVEQARIGGNNNGGIQSTIPPLVMQPRAQGVPAGSGGFISTWCYEDGKDINAFFLKMNGELLKQNGFEPVEFKVVTIFNHSCILVLHKRKY